MATTQPNATTSPDSFVFDYGDHVVYVHKTGAKTIKTARKVADEAYAEWKNKDKEA